jgi:hypothetical protein
MTLPSDAAKRCISNEAQAPLASQRSSDDADCPVTFFDHVPEVDRQQVRDVVAALLTAKRTMMRGGAAEPSLLEVAEALGVGRRVEISR